MADYTSPFAFLVDNLIDYLGNLTETVDGQQQKILRYADQDLGQMENYDIRPAVSYPGVLIDMDETAFDDEAENVQRGNSIVQLRFFAPAWSATNNLVEGSIRLAGLKFYEVEQKVHAALQGYRPSGGYGKLSRLSAKTEKRNDAWRVRVVRYKLLVEDYTTQVQRQPAPASVAIFAKPFIEP